MLGQRVPLRIVGLDVTHSCLFAGPQLQGLAGRGRFGSFLAAITAFYLQYHRHGGPPVPVPDFGLPMTALCCITCSSICTPSWLVSC